MATIHNLKRAPSIARLECSSCGASTDAACNCGAPYVPASARAAKAVAENPEKSDRAIAAELGIDHKTVGKARKTTGDNSPVDERIGLDGKVRKLPKRKPQTDDDMPTEAEANESWQQDVYDHACFLVDERMESETRQRFFAHLKEKYNV